MRRSGRAATSIRRTRPASRTSCRRTIDRGTAARTAARIADELDNRGVSLSITINRHAMWLVCTCLVEDLDPILALLADVDHAPDFPARRSRDEARRDHDADPPGRGQPGDHGGGGSAGGSVRRVPSLRPASARVGRDVEQIDATALRAFTVSASGPRRCRWCWSATSKRAAPSTPRRARSAIGLGRRRPPRACARRRPRRASRARHSDDEQGAGGHRLRVHEPASRRSRVLRLLADEQHPWPVRDWRPARRPHPRARGDGVLRVQRARRECHPGSADDPRRRQS